MYVVELWAHAIQQNQEMDAEAYGTGDPFFGYLPDDGIR